MCDFLELLTHEGANRRAIAEYAKLQAPVRMDFSALQAKEAAAAAATQAAQEAPEPTPVGDAFLDAFGNPHNVINMKEKDTGKLIAHHALELKLHVINAAGGDIMQPSVQARGKAKVMEGKGKEKVIGAIAEKEIGVKAKELGEREEKGGVAKGTEEKIKEASWESIKERVREKEEKRARA